MAPAFATAFGEQVDGDWNGRFCTPPDLPGSSSILGELATDLATEHGENDPNKRDIVKQAGWKNDH